MRKSTLFISAALTTFLLVILAGVMTTYQTLSSPVVEDVQAQAEVAPISQEPVAVVPQPVNLTPDQAADLASQVMGDTELFSVEVTQFNGESVYLITFSSGNLVYMSLDGRILSIDKLDVVVVSAPANNQGNNNNGSKNRNNEEHEDDNNNHREHEEHDD
jgi:hypothetical protein